MYLGHGILFRQFINLLLGLKKPNTDEHICREGGLIRDIIDYSMH